MKVIAIIAQKGGAKKTTTATNLAVAGCEQGLETIIFDANTDQPTANKWSILRRNVQEKETPIVVSSPPSLLQDNIKKAQDNGADLAIIDTGAQSVSLHEKNNTICSRIVRVISGRYYYFLANSFTFFMQTYKAIK